MEREDAGPGPEEIEFLRLDEDGKHAHPVRARVVVQPAEHVPAGPVMIRVASQPAEPGQPNPVLLRIRSAGEPGDHRGSVMTEILEVPWGRIPARDFARDFAARIRSGDPAEVTVLCRNSTETRWFQELAGPSTAICLLTGREPKTGEHTEKESAMIETAEPKAVTIRDVPEDIRTRARWLAAVRATSMNQVLVDAPVSGLPTREQILTEAGEKP